MDQAQGPNGTPAQPASASAAAEAEVDPTMRLEHSRRERQDMPPPPSPLSPPPELGPRVLLVAPDFPPSTGGVQTTLGHLAAGYPPGNLAGVVAPAAPGAAAFDRAQPYRIWRAPGPALRPGAAAAALPGLYATAAAVLARRPVEVLVCGHVLAAPLGLAWGRLTGRPWLLFVYGSELLAGRARPLRQALVRAADHVIANSRFTAAQLAALGVPPARITCLPPAVDATRFRPGLAAAAAQVRARHGLAGRRVVLTVSRLGPQLAYKGHDVLLQALARLRRRWPDVVSLVVGRGDPAYLASLARAAGVADAVVVAGAVPEAALPAYYAAADVFALISRSARPPAGPGAGPAAGPVEGFGTVYLEAAACGVPAVGGAGGGVAEAIVDGETGLVVPPEDPQAVAAALARLLEDHAYAARLGQAARRRVEAAFTWPVRVQQFAALVAAVERAR
jgi:phosphatidylinositol alpha-1,6-mannosyltransferase